MKRKTIGLLLALSITAAMVTACAGGQNAAAPQTNTESANSKEEDAKQDTEAGAKQNEAQNEADDKAKADEVAKLIDAIYVQKRTDETDAQCLAAKEAWDALTDAQKELVEGEYADPDYFGLDTGDASKDDTLNGDDIGENEILVASFGTSFNDSRVMDILSIEKAIAQENPGWEVRRAFTAQIIINHIQARDGMMIDNMDQALERAENNGVKNLIVQPTHLMHGAEYDELMEALEAYSDKFDTIAVAEPLLGPVGKASEDINADKEAVAKAITQAACKEAGYADAKAAADDGAAFVLLGHGTSHTAKVSYSQMQAQVSKLGYDNVFIGTVEGEPEETSCESVIKAVSEAGYTKVILRPLMVVAGDHANNDMAGDDEDSWKSMFISSGAFESIECQIAGLGSIPEVQAVYVEHTKEAIASSKLAGVNENAGADKAKASQEEAKAGTTALEDGEYSVKFDTDSSMFGVSEAMNGRGTLTVKDGKMMLHISLKSKKILNLYPGLAEKARGDEKGWLLPTTDKVKYEDGTWEEVFGFDVPVEKLDEEFDLALVGEKGTWYDHKVSVSDVQK